MRAPGLLWDSTPRSNMAQARALKRRAREAGRVERCGVGVVVRAEGMASSRNGAEGVKAAGGVPGVPPIKRRSEVMTAGEDRRGVDNCRAPGDQGRAYRARH